MAAAEWPAYVPLEFLRQGFSEQDEDQREEFQPEKGPPIRWLSPSAESTIYQGTIPCSKAEKAVLKEFYRDRLGHGVERFERPDPTTGDLADFTFESPISWTEIAEDIWYGSTALRRWP